MTDDIIHNIWFQVGDENEFHLSEGARLRRVHGIHEKKENANYL